MKRILALTIIATLFSLNIASAKQTPANVSKSKIPSSHTSNVKKMKDTDDQLMSKQQQNTTDYFNTKSC